MGFSKYKYYAIRYFTSRILYSADPMPPSIQTALQKSRPLKYGDRGISPQPIEVLNLNELV
jgi:hypothetical protein